MARQQSFYRYIFPALYSLLVLAPMPGDVYAQANLPGLKDLAEPWGIDFGFLVSPENVGNTTYENRVLKEASVATVTAYWKYQVHNEGREEYDWAFPDTTIDFALANDLELHGHPLVYASDEHIPDWVLATPEDEAESRAMLREHIEAVLGRYRGAVSMWHVVNEAFRYTGLPRDSYWYRTLGDDLLEYCFTVAHEADPDLLLCYNDFGLLEIDDRKYEAVKAKLVELKEAGVPVHGIGWQMHLTADKILDEDFPMEQRMQEMSLLGFANYITELDVAIPEVTEANLIQQRDAYHKVSEIFLRVATDAMVADPALEMGGAPAMQTWDVSDQQSWLGTAAAPLLFDTNYEPKLAYSGVEAAFAQLPLSDPDVRVTLSPAGLLLIRGSAADNFINIVESNGSVHVSAFTQIYSRHAATVASDLFRETEFTFPLADVKSIRGLLLAGDDTISVFPLDVLPGDVEVMDDGGEGDADSAEPEVELATLADVTMNIYGASGNEVVSIEDLTVGRTFILSSAGTSDVRIVNTTVTGDLRITGGVSEDVVQLSAVAVEGNTLVSLSSGENELQISDCLFAGNAKLNTGGGADLVNLDGTAGIGNLFAGNVSVSLGGGDDQLLISDTVIDGNTTLNTSGGDDIVRLEGFGEVAGGGGNLLNGSASVLLGGGDDELTVSDTVFDGAFVRLWGYGGADLLWMSNVTSEKDPDIRTIEDVVDLDGALE